MCLRMAGGALARVRSHAPQQCGYRVLANAPTGRRRRARQSAVHHSAAPRAPRFGKRAYGSQEARSPECGPALRSAPSSAFWQTRLHCQARVRSRAPQRPEPRVLANAPTQPSRRTRQSAVHRSAAPRAPRFGKLAYPSQVGALARVRSRAPQRPEQRVLVNAPTEPAPRSTSQRLQQLLDIFLGQLQLIDPTR